MKFVLVLITAVVFNFSAMAQDPHEALEQHQGKGSTPEEMTLVDKKPAKPVKAEDLNAAKKPAKKKKHKKNDEPAADATSTEK